MIHGLHRSGFLRPRERLRELIALEEAERGGGIALHGAAESLFDRRTVAGYLSELENRGLLARDENDDRRPYRLTEAGRRRLHYLLVDYVNELAALHESARDILRRSLAPLSLAGVRRVVFYPHSETAEVAYSVLESLELDLVGIVDDSPRKWETAFHDLRVKPPTELPGMRPDAVIVTTSLFEDSVVAKIRTLALDGVRIHTL
jgi:DNA-binding PadR family transcriptional regulator